MRMGFFFSEVFWGAFLILLGVSAIVKSFNINIPVVRLLIAFFFIYIGISVLFGNGIIFDRDEGTILFSDQIIHVEEISQREYNILFSKGEIDLTNLSLHDKTEKLEINTIFGGGVVKLNSELPVKIKASSAFGNVQMPNNSNVAFGELIYTSGNPEETEKQLIIEANAVFGGLVIKDK